jgi:hypothetical protein
MVRKNVVVAVDVVGRAMGPTRWVLTPVVIIPRMRAKHHTKQVT